MPSTTSQTGSGGLLRVLLTIAALTGLGLLAARLADLVLLVFASVLMAMVLHIVAAPLQARTPMGRVGALSAALGIVTVGSGVIAWLFGSQLMAQGSNLVVLLPKAWVALKADLSASPAGALLAGQIQQAIDNVDGHALAWGSRLLGGVAPMAAGAVIVACASAYLAFHPRTYLGGALMLIPPRGRARAAEVVEACRVALTQWLFGQLVSVAFVSVTATLGLWLVGVPSPLALGVLAGLGQLIPVVGPWCAAFLGLIVAFAAGPQTFAGALLVYFGVTQIESNVLTPLILRRMAQVPMAVTLFAVVAMGMLLGPLGVLLATPLAVVAYVLVRALYLEDGLHEVLQAPTPRKDALLAQP